MHSTKALLPTTCVCGESFTIDHACSELSNRRVSNHMHAMMCVWNLPSNRSQENTSLATANRKDSARLDVRACGFCVDSKHYILNLQNALKLLRCLYVNSSLLHSIEYLCISAAGDSSQLYTVYTYSCTYRRLKTCGRCAWSADTYIYNLLVVAFGKFQYVNINLRDTLATQSQCIFVYLLFRSPFPAVNTVV